MKMDTTLSELRKLNIEQQKKANEVPESASIQDTPETGEIVPAASEAERDETEAPVSASEQIRKSAPAEARKSARVQPPRARAGVSAARKGGERPPSQPMLEHNAEFMSLVRDHLAARRTHSGGVKASVDLDPDLSLRAKRYCLEHGNIPLRLLFIELLSAYLDEEGY